MPDQLDYSIADDIFTRFPGYSRGVVLAYGVTNGPSPAGLLALLRAAEATLRTQVELAAIADHPRIRSWRAAYRAFGAKPSEYRPSVEALARRVLRGDELPSFNALVDIGNVISLQYMVPAGAHAIDVLTEDLTLRPAGGNETFVPLGSEIVEHPEPGEIILAAGNQVLTRRWTWRQGAATVTLPGSRTVEFNVDGLPPVSIDEVERISAALAGLVSRFCGGRVRTELLSAAQPCIRLWE